MNKAEMKACAYVTKRLDDVANEIYQEMYDAWRYEELKDFRIKIPDKLVFTYQSQSLLPHEYIYGELNSKPVCITMA